jgi:hypothetical protein
LRRLSEDRGRRGIGPQVGIAAGLQVAGQKENTRGSHRDLLWDFDRPGPSFIDVFP